MGNTLAVVTVETVETLLEWVSGATDRTKSPFAETAIRVTEFPKRERQLQLIYRHWFLAFRLHGLVLANVTVPRMLAGHEAAARRGADIGTRIMVGKSHAALG